MERGHEGDEEWGTHGLGTILWSSALNRCADWDFRDVSERSRFGVCGFLFEGLTSVVVSHFWPRGSLGVSRILILTRCKRATQGIMMGLMILISAYWFIDSTSFF